MTSSTSRLLATLAFAVAAATACSETTVTVLTQAPPGRSAFVDPEALTLTLTRGVAVALECTTWTEAYTGPCRELAVVLDDEALATILPVHLDALPGQTVRQSSGTLDEATVVGPEDRAGFVLVAAAAGEGQLEVTSAEGVPVTLGLVVEEPPAPPADE